MRVLLLISLAASITIYGCGSSGSGASSVCDPEIDLMRCRATSLVQACSSETEKWQIVEACEVGQECVESGALSECVDEPNPNACSGGYAGDNCDLCTTLECIDECAELGEPECYVSELLFREEAGRVFVTIDGSEVWRDPALRAAGGAQ